jgi:hypothetical protein
MDQHTHESVCAGGGGVLLVWVLYFTASPTIPYLHAPTQ